MKAILVVDMPTDCNECPCYYEEGYRCQVHMEIDEHLDHGKPSWCPLKPMPQKKISECLVCLNLVTLPKKVEQEK